MQISRFEEWSIILFGSGPQKHYANYSDELLRRSSSWRSAVMCRLCVRFLI